MLTNLSGVNSVNGYQAQLTLPTSGFTQVTNQQEPSSSEQGSNDSVRISREARELEQVYQRKETNLEQNHNEERQELEREYLRQKNELEREFQQKKQALEVDFYV